MPRWGRGGRLTSGGQTTEKALVNSSSTCDPSSAWQVSQASKACTSDTGRVDCLSYIDRGRTCYLKASDLEDQIRPDLPVAVREFRDQLRALWLTRRGENSDQVAHQLGRSPHWVEQWSSIEAADLVRPSELPRYIGAYEVRMFNSGVEPFLSAALRRQYMASCEGLFEECLARFPWEQAKMRSRNHNTGEVTKTDIDPARQDCTFPHLETGIPRVDAALARIREDFGISDPGAYLTCNLYADGVCSIAPHRHDFWSAIISLGDPRIFILDKQPLLLRDGDLLVFGSQEHSVPKLLGSVGRRISICVFWYPERKGPSVSLMLKGDAREVECASGSGENMAGLVLQALAELGLQGEVVSGSQNDEDYDDDDEIMAAALERSLVES